MSNQTLFIALNIIVALFLLFGIRIIRPTRRGLIERLGKYRKYAESGFHWIIPVIDRMIPEILKYFEYTLFNCLIGKENLSGATVL